VKLINVRMVVIVVVAFVIGCVIGGTFVQWRMSQRESRPANDQVTREQRQPAANQPKSASREVHSTSSHSVIVNGRRLSDQDIETLTRTFRLQVRDGNYWYDRMTGAWGLQGGPTAGFIMAGLNLGGPLREDASHGDTGVFINGRQLHRVEVALLMQIGPVYPGRCWMDAQGNIGLEGQPAFGNVWVAAAQARGGGVKKEGILSTYDKTGIAVFGY
jgi:hypothetical protein